MKQIAAILIWIALAAAPLCAQENSPYDALILDCNALARDGKYLEAFAKAREAIQANPGRFEAYYYAAFALYNRDMLSDAKMAAADALSRTPADRKPEVQKLVAIIEQREKVQEQVKVAEQAARDGLGGRAAEAYTAAWRLDDTRDDIGLAAAKQWLRVQDYANAARILNEIHDHPHDGPSAPEANQILDSSRPVFLTEFNKRGCPAYAKPGVFSAEAIPAIERCAALAPAESGIVLAMAFVYLRQNDTAHAEAWLLKAARMDKLSITEVLKRIPAPNGPLRDARFLKFIGDVLGPAAVESAQEFNSAIDKALSQADPSLRLRALTLLNKQYENASLAEFIAQGEHDQLPAVLDELRRLLPTTFESQTREISSGDVYKYRFELTLDSIDGCTVSLTQDTVGPWTSAAETAKRKRAKSESIDPKTGLPYGVHRVTASFSLQGATAGVFKHESSYRIETPNLFDVNVHFLVGSARRGDGDPDRFVDLEYADQDQANRIVTLIRDGAAACGRPARKKRGGPNSG